MMTEHGKDASQRVELRERIITAATEAFTSKGIKSITMDDIAAALGFPNVRSTKSFRIKNRC